MNYSQESQLTRDLRELVAGQPSTPDLEAIWVRARKRHRRGRALRCAAAAGAVVLAAGGFFAVHETGGSPAAHSGTAASQGGAAAGTTAGSGGHGSTSAATRTETVAYVTGKVKAALGDVNKYVLRDGQLETGPNGHSATIWTDPRTGNAYEIAHDSDGKSIAWLSTYLVRRVLTWKTVQADYATRTWFVSVMHAAGPIQGSTAGATSTVMTPAEIKGWLDAGRLTIVGHREINGHRAIGLRQPWARGYRELWVDSRTFLPLRTIMADFADTTGPLKNVLLIDNETWLPRTPSLLNMVNHVHIPAGFRQVPPPK
jgi:hypothetical protein